MESRANQHARRSVALRGRESPRELVERYAALHSDTGFVRPHDSRTNRPKSGRENLPATAPPQYNCVAS